MLQRNALHFAPDLIRKNDVFLQVSHTDDGLEAIIFTAQGDMRQVCLLSPERFSWRSDGMFISSSLSLSPPYPQALNNLQSTCAGFGHVNATNVFKVNHSIAHCMEKI